MPAAASSLRPVELGARFDAQPLTPFIGSEVNGLDLHQPVSDETIAALRALLLDRGVIFIPGQHLSPQQHLEFAARFGTVDYPDKPRANAPLHGINVFDSRDQVYGRVSRWHSDLTSREEPQSIAVFQPIKLPAVGGDTQWASTEAAYERLSQPLKDLAEKLTAIHALTPIKVADFGKGEGLGFHWAEHPVVRVHPETGRKSLYVNPRYTAEIVGVRPHESVGILKTLNDHLTQPEHTVRYRWQEGTVALWDNRSTLHYAIDDYGDDLRLVNRVGLKGDRPRGVDALEAAR
jgi:alpha-ketoglutarate-dependent taurine dioxygenase